MNKYKWDFKELRDNRNKLVAIYNESSEEEKMNILPIIEIYNNMLIFARKKKENNEIFDDKFQGLSTMDLIYEVRHSYIEKNLSILDTLLQAYTTVNENYIDDDNLDKKMICDNNQIINITKDYFKKMTPDDINKQFLNEINTNNNFLNFNYAKDYGDYGGVTIFDPILNKKYISVSRANYLFDLVTLPHEMFHYLFNDTNVSAFGNYNTYYLQKLKEVFLIFYLVNILKKIVNIKNYSL